MDYSKNERIYDYPAIFRIDRIPCRRSFDFQGAVLDLAIKIATQQPKPDHPFRDGLGSGSLCSDKKVKNLLRLLQEPSWNSK